jgi:hypothetical protein
MKQILGGGTTYGIIGSALGSVGDTLSGMSGFLNFDMMELGLDFLNQFKGVYD